MKLDQGKLSLGWFIRLMAMTIFSVWLFGLVFLITRLTPTSFGAAIDTNFEWRLSMLINVLVTLAPLVVWSYLLQKSRRSLVKIIVIVAGFLLNGFYSLNFVLLFYRTTRHFPFDFYFFWYNRSGALEVLEALSGISYVVLLFVFLIFVGLLTIGHYFFALYLPQTWLTKNVTNYVIVFTIPVFLLTPLVYKPEVIQFFWRTVKINSVMDQWYSQHYRDSLAANKALDVQTIGTLDGTNLPQNIFVVQQESLNALLVDQTMTPNLVSIARDYGILYDRVHAASVITIRAQEAILCPVLPALSANLALNDTQIDTTQLVCLPKILQARGYKTLFFRSNNLSTWNTGPFMTSIGFDEIHFDDIMQPQDKDKLFYWGYREDIFYQRVFEYLQRYRDEKIFVYIATGTVNHYPFYDPAKPEYAGFEDSVPYPSPKTFRERLIDSLFIQDSFLNDLFYTYYQPTYLNNSYLFITGDHSYPSGLHEANYHNENYAWEENFLIPVVVVHPPNDDRFIVPQQEARFVSQYDLMATIVDLVGLSQKYSSGLSWLDNMFPINNQERCIVSVQPFSDRFIVLVKNGIKHLYNLSQNTVTTYDLSLDFAETTPLDHRAIVQADSTYLAECVNSFISS